jgi:hypothetical protein
MKDNILNEERRKEINTYYKSHVFVTESRGRSQSRFSHGKQDRESSNRESGNRKGKWKREISVKEGN